MEFDIKSLDQMDRARLSAYRSNLDFYNGGQWSERSRYRQLVFNYVKIAVDKVTSYLMNELNFACEGKSADMAKMAEELIYAVYEQNNCAELDYTTEVDTAILGDGCYKVTWDAAEKRVRITAPDVNGVFAWWQGDDITRLYRVASRYQLSAEEVAALYSQRISKKSVAITEVWDAREFILYLDDRVIERKPNP